MSCHWNYFALHVTEQDVPFALVDGERYLCMCSCIRVDGGYKPGWTVTDSEIHHLALLDKKMLRWISVRIHTQSEGAGLTSEFITFSMLVVQSHRMSLSQLKDMNCRQTRHRIAAIVTIKGGAFQLNQAETAKFMAMIRRNPKQELFCTTVRSERVCGFGHPYNADRGYRFNPSLISSESLTGICMLFLWLPQ